MVKELTFLRAVPATHRFQTSFWLYVCLTRFETGTYTEPVTIRRWSDAAFLLIAATFVTSVVLHAQAVQRAIIASVLDSSGAPVSEVSTSDVVVREDDLVREVLRVTPAHDPMQIAVLIDNSQAAERYVRDYRSALPPFISEILAAEVKGGRHQIAIIGVASRPTILSDYSSDEATVLKGVNRIFAESDSGSYLMDGIIEVSRGMIRRSSARPVIVLITTEGIELSERHYQQVLDALMNSGAALHVVFLGSPSNPDEDRNIVLARGPRDSGGGVHTLLVGSALPDRLKQIAVELTHQYQVVYAHPDTLIPPDRVTIAAAGPDLTVRGALAIDQRDVR